jgi:hypothetical protein
MKLYFCPQFFSFSHDPLSCEEGGKEYLVLFLRSQNLGSLFFYNKP